MELFFSDLPEVDICDRESIQNFISQKNIHVIINCAAYTNVDMAETEINSAHKVNGKGPQVLAELAKVNNFLLIHISTDFVFDGNKNTPYTCNEVCNPLSVYGRTKRQGEEHIISIAPQYLIIRTSWLYSSFGNNFVKTIHRLTNEREQLGRLAHLPMQKTWQLFC